MARTTRDYESVKPELYKYSFVPKFPRNLSKTNSMEIYAVQELVNEGYKPTNRMSIRAKGLSKKGRKKFLNSSWRELPKRLRTNA